MTMTLWTSPNRIFCKRIVKRGTEHRRPLEYSTTLVSIETQAELGSYWVNEDNYPRNVTSHNVTVGKGDSPLNSVIDECLLTMDVNEVCEVLINADGSLFRDSGLSLQSSPDHEDDSDTGSAGSGSSSPKRSRSDELVLSVPQVCKFKVTLESIVSRDVEVYELSEEEKLSRSQEIKEKGTKLFKAGHVQFAFRQFSRALKYLVCVGKEKDIPSELYERYKLLKTQCYLNIGACQSQVNNHNSVIKNCSNALALDPDNVKGLYRRGQASAKKGDFAGAKEDLKKAWSLEPTNKVIEKLLNNVIEVERAQDQKLANAMSKMFS